MTIFITGATGFVGTALATSLTNSHFCVKTLGRSKTSDIQWRLGQPFPFEKTHTTQDDVLIHCAWDLKETNLKKIEAINIDGTELLFREAFAKGFKKLIFISTINASENHVSSYARSKFITESKIAAYGAVCVRPGLIYNNDSKGIVGILQKAVRTLPIIPIIDHGSFNIYTTHLNDFTQLIYDLLNVPSPPLIIAANSKPIQFNELIQKIEQKELPKCKSKIRIHIPSYFLFLVLKTLELFSIRIRTRSDSILNLTSPVLIDPKQKNPHESKFREFSL